MFHFKQFSIDQSDCAMKVNTDGVLLGAIANVDQPQNILDIGAGTGVIALMLAQRFTAAKIDAIEIDETAASTAEKNFKNSPFAEQLAIYPLSFEKYFNDFPAKKYDLIVSNPPFHINSLESPKAKKSLAKHTGEDFFEGLIKTVAEYLTKDGLCWMILPLQAAELVKTLAEQFGLYLQNVLTIHSFKSSEPHREIIVLGRSNKKMASSKFVIYNEPQNYSEAYKHTLKDFLTIF